MPEHLARARRSRRACARSGDRAAPIAGATPCLLVSERPDPAVDERRRRRLAEVVARRAPSITAICLRRDRDRRCAPAPRSTTSSVCTHTSPSGCHSGSCGQPTSACSSGNSRSTTPRSQREREADRRPRRLQQQLLDLAPDRARPGGRRAGSLGRARAFAGRASNSKRAANWSARSTRRLSSPNVARIDHAQEAPPRSRRPPNGSRYSSVSGSQAIALIVKSRRRAASAIDMNGSPVHVEALVPAADLRLAAGQRRRRVADLVDGEALADRVRRGRRRRGASAGGRRRGRRPRGRCPSPGGRAGGRAPSRRRRARARRHRARSGRSRWPGPAHRRPSGSTARAGNG